MKPKFSIGDSVIAVAFTDCFGKPHAQVNGLHVVNVQTVPGTFRPDGLPDMAQYYRVLAHGTGDLRSIEGAERFFDFVGVS